MSAQKQRGMRCPWLLQVTAVASLCLLLGGCARPEGSVDPSGTTKVAPNDQFSKGYSAGHDRGYADGRQEGYDEGYDKGFEEGRLQGHSDALECVRGQETAALEAADFCE